VGDEWVPRAEAADRAGVHRNTILDWERRGLVKTRRAAGPTGQQVVVRVVDLDRVIANRPDRAPRSDVAALEAEVKYLRERLAEVTAERENLLRELLDIARGARPR
jgi:DNA-binding transcriptional MerR regulator